MTIERSGSSTETGIEAPAPTIDGIVIGILAGFDESGAPLVIFPGNTSATGMSARSSAVLERDDEGREVALMFENGDPDKPLIIGRIQHPEEFTRGSAPSAGIC